MVLAAATSGDGIGEILAALFPPVATAIVFLLIGRAVLRNTDWKKQEGRGEAAEQRRRHNPPQEPGGSA